MIGCVIGLASGHQWYRLLIYTDGRRFWLWLNVILPNCFEMGGARRCGCRASFVLKGTACGCGECRRACCWSR